MKELKEWRQRMGYTQPQAAEALSTKLSTYKNWELGHTQAPGVLEITIKLLEATR